MLAEAFLDLVLKEVVELDPAALEELDAVVGHRVVGGRKHDAQDAALVVHQVRQARGRDHADIDDVHTGAGQAGADCGGKELTRDSGVAPHERRRASAVEGARFAEYPSGGDGQVHRELGCQVFVRDATDAVGTK